jgi:hypothetical protein
VGLILIDKSAWVRADPVEIESHGGRRSAARWIARSTGARATENRSARSAPV